MLKAVALLLRKDLRHSLGHGAGFIQAVLLGLLLVVLFSLSLGVGEKAGAHAKAAVFWMASLFCQVLLFNSLYAAEETNGQRKGLLLAPMPIQAVWLGKACAGFCLLSATQMILLVALVVFLGAELNGAWPSALLAVILADIGCVAVGSLLGALSQGRNAKESLLSIIVFPLLTPLLLAGVSVSAAALTPMPLPGADAWIKIAAAFDAVFVAAALVLFPFIYTADG